MKKVKYYKKNREKKKIWFSESWGEPLKVVLPNGKILHFACEFYRGDGWYITDTATGFFDTIQKSSKQNRIKQIYQRRKFLEGIGENYKYRILQKIRSGIDRI